MLLDQSLLLLLKLVYEVMSNLLQYRNELSRHSLVHHIFELYLLTDNIYSCTSFLKQPLIEVQTSLSFDTQRLLGLVIVISLLTLQIILLLIPSLKLSEGSLFAQSYLLALRVIYTKYIRIRLFYPWFLSINLKLLKVVLKI